MRLIKELAALQGEYQGVVLTLGNFDGIHLGHQEILKRVVARAGKFGTASLVFTFQEHPLKLLAAEKAPPLLTSLEEKFSLLEGLGIGVVVCIPFTREIASTPAEQFIQDIIYALLRPRWIVVGHDYAFGKNRSGDPALLQHKAAQYGYQLEVVGAVEAAGVTVSSSIIRRKIAQGKVREAAQLLGRPYSLRSRVIAGRQKGKELCRTANLAIPPKLLPACGVYAVKVRLGNEIHQGVANIGYQPTYGQNELQMEVHLLDFSADLYGHKLEVAFIAKLREEQKFPNPLALKKQIDQDIRRARQILAERE